MNQTDVTRQRLMEALESHIRALSADIGERNIWRPEALRATAEYIRREWHAQGFSVTEHTYEIDGNEWKNLEVTAPSARALPSILIGAHYDTVFGSPGANDNGSGVATLLELTRLLKDTDARHSLRFVAFVNEEAPFFGTPLQGSEVYASRARELGIKIKLMLSLETLGYFSDRPGSQQYPPVLRRFYPDQANFIAMVSNMGSLMSLRQFVKAFRNSSDFPVRSLAAPDVFPGLAWSDHRAFWRNGYRAIMVTDTAFYRYPYYHTARDTAEHVCFGPLADVTLGLAGAIESMARGMPRRAVVRR